MTAPTSGTPGSLTPSTTAARPQGAPAAAFGGGLPVQRQFVNFIFYKLDPAFRRLGTQEKTAAREEFLALF